MKKILCPTDFSETALNAITYAAKFAQVTNSELIIFNVQSLTEKLIHQAIFSNTFSSSDPSAELEALSREVSISFKISCYAEVESSKDTLAKTIERKASDYDLIIMGTCGDDDLFDFLSGSNTYNVIRKSKTPVLVIPPKCSYGSISQIVYAFDYLKERSLPLDQLIPWVNALKCELTVLQIMEEAQSEDVDDELKELQSVINELNSSLKIKFDTLRSAHTSEGLKTYSNKKEIDVLALCTNPKNLMETIFHKSVIKNFSGQSRTYPVLVFHH